MKKAAKKRGRPPKPDSKTAAERMRSYRQRKKAAGLKSVRRWEPAEPSGVARFSDHQVLDARSLALHCAIAQKINADPALLGIARRNLARWSSKAGKEAPKYLKEWQGVLERPWPEIAHFIMDYLKLFLFWLLPGALSLSASVFLLRRRRS